MRRGRSAPPKRMARGGRTRPRPSGKRMARGGRTARRMAGGGCMPGTPGCPQSGGYRGGGRTRPITTRRMARGGRAGGVRQFQAGGSSAPMNSGCSMWTGEIDCGQSSGCTWNYSTGMCH